MIRESSEIKVEFKNQFRLFLNEQPLFKFLLFDIFVEGTAYVVGGYFRDFLFRRHSRDLDIIIDLPNTTLLEKVEASKIPFQVNRHKGIKLLLNNFEVDIWSLENNWAFKERLVKLNPEDKLHSIVKGCFYNYDALAINLHTFNFNIQYFTNFISTATLDILQENPEYKRLNPTIEANILRAFYIQKISGARFSANTKIYLLKKLGQLSDTSESSISKLCEVKKRYPKYDRVLKDLDIYIMSHEIIKGIVYNRQFYLDL